MNIQILKTFSCVENLNPSRTKRCGIVPIKFEDNENHIFVMAIDTIYGQLTDPGGTIEQGESVVETGFREFNEETSNLFCDVYPDIQSIEDNFYCAMIDYYRMVMVIFVSVPFNLSTKDVYDICRRYSGRENKENSGLVCIPLKQLNLLSKEPIVSNENSINSYKYSGVVVENNDMLATLNGLYNKCIITYPVMYSRIKNIMSNATSRFFRASL